MSDQAPKDVATQTPADTLLGIARGYRAAQAVWVAATLGIADLLAEGAKSVDELAAATGTHAPTLHRLLRALASIGVFAEDAAEEGEHRFRLTPLAEPLQREVAGSVYDLVRLNGDPIFFEPWGQLLYSVQTGQPAFDHLHGTGLYTYLTQHPEAGAVFNAAMAATPGLEGVIAAIDFAGARMVIDVGGGSGSLVAAILHAHPSLTGVLFDLPGVADEARERIVREGLSERCSAVGGDFFESVPEGGDLYTLFDVVHNWNDERATAILTNCRRAMPNDGRLLLIERVLLSAGVSANAAFSDLNGLVVLGGRERTAEEHRAVLASAGLRLSRVIPTTRTPWSIVEAIPEHGAAS